MKIQQLRDAVAKAVWGLGVSVEELLVALASAAVAADALDPRRGRATALDRLSWAFLALCLAGRLAGPIAFEAAPARGALGATLSIATLSAIAFLCLR